MSASTTTSAANASSPFASWKVDHAGIRVPDFEEAVAWYSKTLDFRLLRTVALGELTFGFFSSAADDSFSFEILAGPGAYCGHARSSRLEAVGLDHEHPQ